MKQIDLFKNMYYIVNQKRGGKIYEGTDGGY